jgi:PKD domain
MSHRHHSPSAPRRAVPVLIVVLALLTAAAPTVTHACALDGVVSLAVNGRPAARTPWAPTAKTRATWAPFLLGTQVLGDQLRFTEDQAKLRRSLPADVLAHPFRWDYGDGATATAQQGVHRYRRPGLYKVTVQGYWPSRRTWLPFDSAQIIIVPPAPLTPLERVRALLLPGAVYGLPVAGVLLLLWGLRRRRGARAEVHP